MTVLEFTEKYLGMGYSKCNCYQLLQLYYLHVLDIELQDQVIEFTNYKSVNNMIKSESLKWLEIKEPIKHCVLTFQEHPKYINHVGVYLGAGKFIHSDLNRGIIIDSINDSHYRGRVRGIYNHKSNA